MPRPLVLIADDEPGVLELLRGWARELGWESRGVGDGQAALDELQGAAPALVLTDVSMPRLDGIGLLQEIRRTFPSVPVVVRSADAGKRAAALRGGAQAFLLKPFDRQELRDVIPAGAPPGGPAAAGGQEGVISPTPGGNPPASPFAEPRGRVPS